jgi:hypothetical protein
MKKNWIIIVVISFWSAHYVVAQKQDYVWPLGYGVYWEINSPPYGELIGGGQLLDFTENAPTNYLQPFPLKQSLTSICDSEGNIIAFTDGCRISNAEFELMENGDSINAGEAHDKICGTFEVQATSYPVWQGVIFLNDPADSSRYYLLQSWVDWDRLTVTELKYSVIDFSDNLLGAVVQKDVELLADTMLSDYIAATRHANGRDWWVITPNYRSNGYHILLIDPTGIHHVQQQFVGTAAGALTEYAGQVCFTPRGDQFIKFIPNVGLHIFEFDRCAGDLFSPLFLSFDSIPAGAGGVAVSPNGRFLYVSAGFYVYQYDLWAVDVDASRVTVGTYDGVGAPFNSAFAQAMCGPDGKIYLVSVNTNHILHVIHQPNRKGADCELELRGYRLQSLTNFQALNFPHFRLGPMDGTTCDTLGLDNVPLARFRWAARDTTNHRLVSFTDLSAYEPATRVWSFGDPASGPLNNMSADETPEHLFTADGTYQVCLTVTNNNGSHTLCQGVTVELPVISTTTLPTQVSGFQAFAAPNPATDRVWLNTNGSVGPVQYTAFDGLGRVQSIGTLSATSDAVSLANWPAGIYFFHLRDAAGHTAVVQVVCESK